MKRIIYLSVILPLLLFSCSSKESIELTPEARFSTETVDPEVGEEVFFTNDSRYAESFEWDFGDGYISNEVNPSHIYTGTGTFEVTLTAISKSGFESKATLIMDVMIPTLLEIEVLEWETEILVPDASVYLYSSLTDWDAQENIISEGFTDANSKVVFSGLDPIVYYVDIWEQYHDNYTLRVDDVSFIRSPEIMPHQLNRFVAWVDYVDHGKGTGRGPREVIIKKIERKASDIKRPDQSSGTETWQELYNRRAVQK